MVRRIFPLFLLTLAFALPVCVRAQSISPSNPLTPNWEFYGGYSYVFTEYGTTPGNINTHGMTGWDTSLKLPVLTPWLGIKGDVSGIYNNDNLPLFNPKTYYFLLGPQVSMHLSRSTLFAHGMIGSAHLTDDALPNLQSHNSLATAVGAGLDAGFSRHWAWRVTGDYYNTHFHQTSTVHSTVSQILNSHGRISTGPVFRF